ncbi:MAG: YqzL family protein [Firmicutes bacterium]|nr:YqzL family protein [Candidatus Fermentithermobacillaceae bacterium]
MADLFWSVFEMTGSVTAYLLYRRYSNSNAKCSRTQDVDIQ